MNKQEFLVALRNYLNDLSAEDIRRSLDFYAEMIDDYMEDGMTEEDAIAAVGDITQIADQIRSDAGAAPQKPKRKIKGWSLALIALSFPVWLPLLISAAAIIFSLYATALALGISSLVLLLSPFLFIPSGNLAGACLFLGGALVVTGITILFFITLKPITKAVVWLTKKLFRWTIGLFMRKEAAQ